MTRPPVGPADASDGSSANAVRRDRMSKGWPMDVGNSGPPAVPQAVNSRSGGNPVNVRTPSALEYQTYETVPGQQQHVVHNGVPVGYVQRYQDPGHGALWSATVADQVHARRPDHVQTQRGFVHASDAAHHVMDAHRDVAQVESSGIWRPGPVGGGPNVPGH